MNVLYNLQNEILHFYWKYIFQVLFPRDYIVAIEKAKVDE